MKKIMTLALMLTLTVTTAFAAPSRPTMEQIDNYAWNVSELVLADALNLASKDLTNSQIILSPEEDMRARGAISLLEAPDGEIKYIDPSIDGGGDREFMCGNIFSLINIEQQRGNIMERFFLLKRNYNTGDLETHKYYINYDGSLDFKASSTNEVVDNTTDNTNNQSNNNSDYAVIEEAIKSNKDIIKDLKDQLNRLDSSNDDLEYDIKNTIGIKEMDIKFYEEIIEDSLDPNTDEVKNILNDTAKNEDVLNDFAEKVDKVVVDSSPTTNNQVSDDNSQVSNEAENNNTESDESSNPNNDATSENSTQDSTEDSTVNSTDDSTDSNDNGFEEELQDIIDNNDKENEELQKVIDSIKESIDKNPASENTADENGTSNDTDSGNASTNDELEKQIEELEDAIDNNNKENDIIDDYLNNQDSTVSEDEINKIIDNNNKTENPTYNDSDSNDSTTIEDVAKNLEDNIKDNGNAESEVINIIKDILEDATSKDKTTLNEELETVLEDIQNIKDENNLNTEIIITIKNSTDDVDVEDAISDLIDAINKDNTEIYYIEELVYDIINSDDTNLDSLINELKSVLDNTVDDNQENTITALLDAINKSNIGGQLIQVDETEVVNNDVSSTENSNSLTESKIESKQDDTNSKVVVISISLLLLLIIVIIIIKKMSEKDKE